MKFDKETNTTAENFLGFRYNHPYQSLRQKSSKHDRYQQQQKDNGSIPDTAEAYSCVQVLTYNSYMNIFRFLEIRPNLVSFRLVRWNVNLKYTVKIQPIFSTPQKQQ